MKTLKFSHNDNNKLHCDAFMHVDFVSPHDYPLDHGYKIFHRGVYLGEAKLRERSTVRISKLTESLASITTGFSRTVLLAELAQRAASRHIIISQDTPVYILCFKYLHYAKDHPLYHLRHSASGQRSLSSGARSTNSRRNKVNHA